MKISELPEILVILSLIKPPVQDSAIAIFFLFFNLTFPSNSLRINLGMATIENVKNSEVNQLYGLISPYVSINNDFFLMKINF